MAELLLELASEEIPARMQARAAADLKRLVVEKLTAAGIAHAEAAAFATPRRLALVVKGLPQRQPDAAEERKGPKVGAPEAAVQGFLKAAGLTALDQAEIRETDKGQVYFALRKIAGRATAEVLPEIIAQTLAAFPWPKSMRWGEGRARWVRPLHSVLALFGGSFLELGKAAAALDFPATTRFGATEARGHALMDPAAIAPSSYSDYRSQLERHFVILDPEKRKRSILEQAEDLAAGQHLRFRHDDGLLDEVAGLVEWPLVLLGGFEADFLAVPPEILVTSMRTHQKYFALETPEGSLANRFLLVANVEAPEGSRRRANIVAGNERVLRARLADARFFWEQDRKVKLADRVKALDTITWHAKLGTIGEKVKRIEALAVEIAKHVPGADEAKVRRAAQLAKADLTTGMVGEFPELQGVMGRYYALHDKEDKDVANAVADHWGPVGPSDKCPTAPVSVAVALADKIDSLVGFFGVGEVPTGSRDPFALRRAALGVIRLLVENKLRLGLRAAFAAAARELDSGVALKQDELIAFLADRLKVALREQGVRHDLIDAVFALGGEDDLVRLLARVEALRGFIESDDGKNLLVAYRRAANIVKIEAKKDKLERFGDPASALLKQPEEHALAKALDAVSAESGALVAKEDFAGAMRVFAGLRRPVDAFFEKVTVNAPEQELRRNRLGLLQLLAATMDKIADFSKIEG